MYHYSFYIFIRYFHPSSIDMTIDSPLYPPDHPIYLSIVINQYLSFVWPFNESIWSLICNSSFCPRWPLLYRPLYLLVFIVRSFTLRRNPSIISLASHWAISTSLSSRWPLHESCSPIYRGSWPRSIPLSGFKRSAFQWRKCLLWDLTASL